MSMEQHQEDDNSFEQGFASVMDPSYVEPTTADAVAGETDDRVYLQEQSQAASVGAGADTPAATANADQDPKIEDAGREQFAAGKDGDKGQASVATGAEGSTDAEQKVEDVVLAGLTESEIRNLFAQAAEVNSLKEGLRKAHGKIGELNGRLKEHAPQSAPGYGGAALTGLEGEAFDQAVTDLLAKANLDASGTFGDFSEESMLRGIATTFLKLQQTQLPAQVKQEQAASTAQSAFDANQQIGAQQQTQAQTPQQTYNEQHQAAENHAAANGQPQQEPAPTNLDVERLVLDQVRPGWREKVGGQDFNLWLAAQGQSVQQSYLQASTAVDFAGVLDQFDQWTTARQAAVTKSAQAQKRLEGALTPSGQSRKPHAAPTEDDDFEAGFNSVMKQR